ncbi:hypothetical protein C0992_011581, partial [Termitomyces sp. T32_za158]
TSGTPSAASTSAASLQVSPTNPMPTPTPTPLSMNIVNTVSGGNGLVVFVTKKARKVRKDKGIKRKKPTSAETVSNAE